MQLSTLNLGIFLAYWIDFGFTQSFTASFAWRIPVILQCVFLMPMIFLLFLVPETPRYLAIHSAPSESLAVLNRLHGETLSADSINALHVSILESARLEASIGSGSWGDLLHNDEISSQYRFLLACGIQSFQQLGGINALVYFSSTLFESSIGLSPHLSALLSGYLQTWFFIASFIPWLLIDRVGRRPLLLSMISVMAAVMAVQTGLVSVIETQPGTAIARSSAIGAAAMFFIFEGAFTIGFQATVWVYPSEVLPLRLRQRGSAVSTACNWILNYFVVQITPIALDRIGYRTYIIFAVLNTAWVPLIYLFFPETKGLELEEVDRLFLKDGVEGEVGGLQNSLCTDNPN
jgi:sugar porter (SP) family MFS transporter